MARSTHKQGLTRSSRTRGTRRSRSRRPWRSGRRRRCRRCARSGSAGKRSRTSGRWCLPPTNWMSTPWASHSCAWSVRVRSDPDPTTWPELGHRLHERNGIGPGGLPNSIVPSMSKLTTIVSPSPRKPSGVRESGTAGHATRRVTITLRSGGLRMDLDLTGHRAVVTGASVGIGAETVRVLAAHGADVAFCACTPDAVDALVAELAAARRRQGPRLRGRPRRRRRHRAVLRRGRGRPRRARPPREQRRRVAVAELPLHDRRRVARPVRAQRDGGRAPDPSVPARDAQGPVGPRRDDQHRGREVPGRRRSSTTPPPRPRSPPPPRRWPGSTRPTACSSTR